MRLFGLPEKGYRGEHFQNKPQENRWDDMGNYFEGADLKDWPAYEAPSLGEPYAPNGRRTEQLILPGMAEFEHTLGHLVMTGEMTALDAYNELGREE